MTKRTVQRTDFPGNSHQFLDSEEDEKSMEALDAVGEVLHGADVAITERRIIWSDGERLSVDQTAERIHKQSGADLGRIKIHVIGWLEMGFVPNGLNEKEMELFEIQIGDWVDEYEAGNFS